MTGFDPEMQRCQWQGMPSGRVWRTPIKGTSPSTRDSIILLNTIIRSSFLTKKSKVEACLNTSRKNSKTILNADDSSTVFMCAL